MLITVSDTVATAMHQIAQRESCPCEISILARKECIGE
jgi:antitoxin component of RelBE/YafQ-DinJ toxin-antitoxin module